MAATEKHPRDAVALTAYTTNTTKVMVYSTRLYLQKGWTAWRPLWNRMIGTMDDETIMKVLLQYARTYETFSSWSDPGPGEGPGLADRLSAGTAAAPSLRAVVAASVAAGLRAACLRAVGVKSGSVKLNVTRGGSPVDVSMPSSSKPTYAYLFSFAEEKRLKLEEDVETDPIGVAMRATEHVVAFYRYVPGQREKLGKADCDWLEPTENSTQYWGALMEKLRHYEGEEGESARNIADRVAIFMHYSDGRNLCQFVRHPLDKEMMVAKHMFVFTPEQRAKILEDFNV